MISLQGVTFWFPGVAEPALRDVHLDVGEGELVVVTGSTGSGKTTLLRMLNGLVPDFTGGHLEGWVLVDGHDTRDHPPREMAELVGYVGQDPLAGFVTETVEEELAYGMEQLAVPAPVMRRRVEETLDLLGIAHLRRRTLRTLSGGEQQRVAIGAVLAMHPKVLVLDEPTSALDPAAAEDVLAAVLRLVHDLGVTALVAEHRLERIVEYADRLVLVRHRTVTDGPVAALIVQAEHVPPVVELGRTMQWSPVPLSVRDARRAAVPLRRRLDGVLPDDPAPAPGRVRLTSSDVVVRHRQVAAVRGADLVLRAGEIVALMGRNGSGKSSWLWALRGAARRAGGQVLVDGHDPAGFGPADATGQICLVPQEAGDLLYLDTVHGECTAADSGGALAPGTTRTLLDRIAGPATVPGDAHPRDLSEGQRLSLALSVQLAARPGVVLLDEPTRGLDYAAKRRLASVVAELAAEDAALLVATHDVEFVASVAHRVVVMAQGQVVTDAPVRDAVVGSPIFAPQVAKVMAPLPLLTVADVLAAQTRQSTATGAGRG
ncbi:MAG: ABC transporter ATP-binding protein [Nocardioidaceae bacterium]